MLDIGIGTDNWSLSSFRRGKKSPRFCNVRVSITSRIDSGEILWMERRLTNKVPIKLYAGPARPCRRKRSNDCPCTSSESLYYQDQKRILKYCGTVSLAINSAVFKTFNLSVNSDSTSTLLAGWREGHPAYNTMLHQQSSKASVVVVVVVVYSSILTNRNRGGTCYRAPYA